MVASRQQVSCGWVVIGLLWGPPSGLHGGKRCLTQQVATTATIVHNRVYSAFTLLLSLRNAAIGYASSCVNGLHSRWWLYEMDSCVIAL